jgi:hypothetical protein
LPKRKTSDMALAEENAKADTRARAKAEAKLEDKPDVDVYLAKLNATIYSDEYIPMAMRVAELSQKSVAKDYPRLSLTNSQLQRIKVEPHVLAVRGNKEKLEAKLERKKGEVVDNAVVWMVFKIPSEFNLNLEEVEDIIGLLQFGFGKYGTCKIEEFHFIGKNYEEEP